MDLKKTHEAYKVKAAYYDRSAAITIGDRERQGRYLADLLALQEIGCRRFIDLGCGTGFFSKVIVDQFPDAAGLLLDFSEEMLAIAKDRFAESETPIEYHCGSFVDVPWDAHEPFDVAFSGYAIHHLDDAGKWKLYGEICSHLNSNGIFVLFENFLPRSQHGRMVIEHLTCKDIVRRSSPLSPKLEDVIKKDREVKAAEGDQEAPLEENLRALREAGFGDVVPVFLEGRYGGIAAYKN